MHALNESLFETIDTINDRVVTIRHELHAHPELSGHEEHTSFLIKGILEAEGFRVRSFIDNYGLIAEIVVDEAAPFIALRADIDALPIQERNDTPYASQTPGIMHACGHDSHTAILLGSALALKSVAERLSQNLRFIFSYNFV